MRFFKRKRNNQSEYITRVYLLYSQDGNNYEKLDDITDDAHDIAASVLPFGALICGYYHGNGYYTVAMTDPTYGDDILHTTFQCAFFKNGGFNETLTMSKMELPLGKNEIQEEYGRYDKLQETYSYHGYLFRCK